MNGKISKISIDIIHVYKDYHILVPSLVKIGKGEVTKQCIIQWTKKQKLKTLSNVAKGATGAILPKIL